MERGVYAHHFDGMGKDSLLILGMGEKRKKSTGGK